MAPNVPNIAGIWASDAETKNKLQMAPIKDAAPMPKQTMPRAIFSAVFIIDAPDWKYTTHFTQFIATPDFPVLTVGQTPWVKRGAWRQSYKASRAYSHRP